jgi:hypothetical protein
MIRVVGSYLALKLLLGRDRVFRSKAPGARMMTFDFSRDFDPEKDGVMDLSLMLWAHRALMVFPSLTVVRAHRPRWASDL